VVDAVVRAGERHSACDEPAAGFFFSDRDRYGLMRVAHGMDRLERACGTVAACKRPAGEQIAAHGHLREARVLAFRPPQPTGFGFEQGGLGDPCPSLLMRR
jgi:hypothetical protein